MTAEQGLEKGWTRCTRCGCRRPERQLDGGACRDVGWCAKAVEVVAQLAALPKREADVVLEVAEAVLRLPSRRRARRG